MAIHSGPLCCLFPGRVIRLSRSMGCFHGRALSSGDLWLKGVLLCDVYQLVLLGLGDDCLYIANCLFSDNFEGL